MFFKLFESVLKYFTKRRCKILYSNFIKVLSNTCGDVKIIYSPRRVPNRLYFACIKVFEQRGSHKCLGNFIALNEPHNLLPGKQLNRNILSSV